MLASSAYVFLFENTAPYTLQLFFVSKGRCWMRVLNNVLLLFWNIVWKANSLLDQKGKWTKTGRYYYNFFVTGKFLVKTIILLWQQTCNNAPSSKDLRVRFSCCSIKMLFTEQNSSNTTQKQLLFSKILFSKGSSNSFWCQSEMRIIRPESQ